MTRRARVLVAARELMLEKGYVGTSVDMICKKAGVTKGAFFHHFSSKDMMAVELLKNYMDSISTAMAFSRDPHMEKRPLKRLRYMLDQLGNAYLSLHNKPSCLIGRFAMEIGEDSREIGELCRNSFQFLVKGVEYEIRESFTCLSKKSKEPQKMALGAIAMLEGAITLARSLGDKSIITDQMNYYADLVECKISQQNKLDNKIKKKL